MHERIAKVFLSSFIKKLQDGGCEVRGCKRTREIVDSCWVHRPIQKATNLDYATEFLDKILSVRVVSSLEEAVEHIKKYGSAHTDAIVTKNKKTAKKFVELVDSSSVMVNASTRFSDGNEFGLGAEIGISTDKIHARGPMGLEGLTSYKYVVTGSGQVRE